jgi:hypothetical protein
MISFGKSVAVGVDIKTVRWTLNTSELYEWRAIRCSTETRLASLLHDISCYQRIRKTMVNHPEGEGITSLRKAHYIL